MGAGEINKSKTLSANTGRLMENVENAAEPVEKTAEQAEWELLEKERKVVELRQMGITYEVIAKQVGYASPSGAFHAYERALARYPRETIDRKRDLADDRIERLLAGVWTKALRGEIPAIMATIKLFERQAKLLGLDAPVKTESRVEVFEGGSEIDEQVRRFAYLIAEIESQNNVGTHSDREQTLLGIEGAIESDSADGELANVVDPVGSRVGEDSLRGGVDSVGSDNQTEDTVGDSSEDIR